MYLIQWGSEMCIYTRICRCQGSAAIDVGTHRRAHTEGAARPLMIAAHTLPVSLPVSLLAVMAGSLPVVLHNFSGLKLSGA